MSKSQPFKSNESDPITRFTNMLADRDAREATEKKQNMEKFQELDNKEGSPINSLLEACNGDKRKRNNLFESMLTWERLFPNKINDKLQDKPTLDATIKLVQNETGSLMVGNVIYDLVMDRNISKVTPDHINRKEPAKIEGEKPNLGLPGSFTQKVENERALAPQITR